MIGTYFHYGAESTTLKKMVEGREGEVFRIEK
jgi:hypothetical protein